MTEDEGPPLSAVSADADILENVVRRIAALQIDSTKHSNSLLRHGCHDHRLPCLLKRLPDLTPYLEEAVDAQEEWTGPRIEPARIRRIQEMFEEGAARILDLEIPDALMHCDFSVDNILVSKRGSLFADWAQASVGLPFVTFEQLRLQLMQCDRTGSLVSRLSHLYRDLWKSMIPASRIETAFALVLWLRSLAISAAGRIGSQ